MAQSLDDEAFTRFVAASQASLYRAAWCLVGDADLAEDLVQDTLVKTYLAWGRVRREGALAYARAVLVNANIDRLRRRHVEPPLPEGWDAAGVWDTPAEVAQRDAVARLLAVLPRRQRQVVVLRYAQDLSEEESARLLGISLGTVKSNASRALATLRAHLSTRREVQVA